LDHVAVGGFDGGCVEEDKEDNNCNALHFVLVSAQCIY
jgi:hypothetical protein